MAQINPTLPTIGQPNATEDPDVRAALAAILGVINGGIDETNLAGGSFGPASLTDALANVLGVSKVGTARRGYAEVLTTESTASSTYVNLTTAGPSVTVNQPNPGLTFVFSTVNAQISSGGGSAFTAVNIDGGVVNRTLFATNQTSATPLVTSPGASSTTSDRTGVEEYTSPNFLSGGPIMLNLPGTHAYSLRHLAASGGTASFGSRKLWVWTVGF